MGSGQVAKGTNCLPIQGAAVPAASPAGLPGGWHSTHRHWTYSVLPWSSQSKGCGTTLGWADPQVHFLVTSPPGGQIRSSWPLQASAPMFPFPTVPATPPSRSLLYRERTPHVWRQRSFRWWRSVCLPFPLPIWGAPSPSFHTLPLTPAKPVQESQKSRVGGLTCDTSGDSEKPGWVLRTHARGGTCLLGNLLPVGLHRDRNASQS